MCRLFSFACLGASLLLVSSLKALPLESALLTALSSVATATTQTEPAFFVDNVTLPANRVLVLPISLEELAESRRTFPIRSDNPQVLAVDGPAEVLKGKSVGYFRVQTGVTGDTTLRMGWQELAVTVEADTPVSILSGGQPRITTPINGALIWGTITVGVEIPKPLTAAKTEVRRLQLFAGDRLITEQAEPLHREGERLLRYAFELEVDRIHAGPQQLRAEAHFADGSIRSSESVLVGALRVRPGDLIAGETEAIDLPLEERPRGYGRRQPRANNFGGASGGKVNQMNSGNPSWLLPLDVPQDGHYQMIARVAGHEGAGALPSVHLRVHDDENEFSQGRLVRTDLHRIPIGAPVHLKQGSRIVALRFMNDFAAGENDRNLFLDHFELLAVEPLLAVGKENAAARSVLEIPLGEPKVAFAEPLHGRFIGGAFKFEALALRPPGQTGEAPTVALFLNDRVIDVQQSFAPKYALNRSALQSGANTLRLVADFGNGLPPVSTPTQSVIAVGEVEPAAVPRRHRFPVTGPGWSDFTYQHLEPVPNHAHERVAALYSNAALDLRLPDTLEGHFQVIPDATAHHFRGPVEIRVSVIDDDGETFLGDRHKYWGGWADRSAGAYDFKPGSKFIRVAFINDLYEHEKGDRNFFLRSLVLSEVSETPDKTAPGIEIAYPQDYHTVHEADVVVARLWDDDRIASVDLLLNGEKLDLKLEPPNGEGLFAIPLPVFNLPPGEHRWALLARDAAGNETRTKPYSFTLLEHAPEQPGPYARAVHLLNRFGFGPEPGELARLLVAGERAWLRERIEESPVNPAVANVRTYNELRFRDPGRVNYVQMRALAEFTADPNPVRARFLHFTQNHFSTWIRKTEAHRKMQEHQAFAKAGITRFGDLLWTSATSPAMLHYLDQQRSFKGRLNENYAREVLELHTFGVDNGYAQEDVTRLAGLLTGWTYNEQAALNPDLHNEIEPRFHFDPELNEPEGQEVVGLRFEASDAQERFERIRLILETLAGAPYTARFISTKLTEHYIRTPAPEDAVADLARVYLETGGDIGALLLALAEHPDFWAARTDPRLAKPLEYGLRLYRVSSEYNYEHVLRGFMQNTGTGLFEHATPDGLPEDDAAYASSNALMQRWRFVTRSKWTLLRLTPPGWRKAMEAPTPAAQKDMLQLVSQRLTGYPLRERSVNAALEALNTSQTRSTERIHEVTQLVGMMPESNFR